MKSVKVMKVMARKNNGAVCIVIVGYGKTTELWLTDL